MDIESEVKLVFFYGLFMDGDILREKGIFPESSIPGYVDDYELNIGERATLNKTKGKRTFGSLMSLTAEELEKLYNEASVTDYIPEKLVAKTFNGESLAAVTYVLPLEKLSGRNIQYAVSLAAVAKKIGLPDEYVIEIEQWAIEDIN